MNNRCYSGVWAVVAGLWARPKLAEGWAGPQNGLEIVGRAVPKIFGPCTSLPVRKENEMALQRAEMRMVRWICGVKLKDSV